MFQCILIAAWRAGPRCATVQVRQPAGRGVELARFYETNPRCPPPYQLIEGARAVQCWVAADDLAIRRVLEAAGIEFIDENGGGPGVRLRKRQRPKQSK